MDLSYHPTEVTKNMARHFMHNGPAPDSDEAVMISRFHARTTSTPRATLSALSWAADKADMSYGRFLQTLRPTYVPHIQQEYETDEGMKASYAREARRGGQGERGGARQWMRADS